MKQESLNTIETINNNKTKQSLKIILGIIILLVFDIIFEFYLTSTRDIIKFDTYLGNGIYQQLIMFVSGIILYLIFVNRNLIKLFGKFKNSMKYVLYFMLFFPLILIFIYFLIFLFDKVMWSNLINDTLPSAKHLRDVLIFETIFPGLGEEFLFRGFGLSLCLSGYFLYNKKPHKIIVILSISLISIIFCLAHLNYQFDPIKISFDSYQLATALFVGAFEGFVFYKSKNIVFPILIHNISNIFLTMLPILISLVF